MIVVLGLPVIVAASYCVGVVAAIGRQQKRLDAAFFAGWTAGTDAAATKTLDLGLTPVVCSPGRSATSLPPRGGVCGRSGEEVTG